MIYFITDGDCIKIGKANDIYKRLSLLQTSTYRDIKIIKVINGDIKIERELHLYFNDVHVKREWFRISESELIKRLEIFYPNIEYIDKTDYMEMNRRKIPILRTDLDGGNQKVYPSIITASQDTNIDFAYIGKACKKKSHRAFQYKWYYINS